MNRITTRQRETRLVATARVLPAIGPVGPTIVLRFESNAKELIPTGLDFRDFASAVAKISVLQAPVRVTRGE